MRGFTLIEFLLYITIVATVVLIAGGIGLNVLLGKAKLSALQEVSQNARFSIEKIAYEVRNAEAINSPAPGLASSTLSLQMAVAGVNPTVFDLSNGVLRIQEGTSDAINLTSSEVTVSSVQFLNVSYSGTPGTVRVEMTVTFTNPDNRQEYTVEQTFYTTANVRE